MYTSRKLQKFLASSLIAGTLMFSSAIHIFDISNIQISSVAHAETHIIETIGEYTTNNDLNDNINTSIEHAREYARNLATLEASHFVKNNSELQNLSLNGDIFPVIAAMIIEDVESEDVSFISADDGKSTKVSCRIKVKFDADKINIDRILASEFKFQNMVTQNKTIQAKEIEIANWKAMYEKATSYRQKSEIKAEYDKSQQQFLVTKYERDLSLYDIAKGSNWHTMSETASKLQAIDPMNVTAFSATICAYRESGSLKQSVEYCNRILESNCPFEIAIEAYAQLGDIYLNGLNDKETARNFIDKGIALVKQNYSAATIEELVNGTNFRVRNLESAKKPNTIHALYVLKSDVEDINPTIKFKSEMYDLELLYDIIYDIKYKTNW